MRTLLSFQGVHRNETIVVCGCGESLNELTHPERFITIGISDVGRLFQPNYLLVSNPREQYDDERFHYIETSRPEYVFTYLPDLPLAHLNMVLYGKGGYNGTDFSDPNVLNYSDTSAYVALCLAAHMGASCIGVIGVDFTDNHFFGKTGKHRLSPHLTSIDERLRRLNEALKARGVKVFNLSSKSRLTTFPKMPLQEFAALTLPPTELSCVRTPLRIVSYATMPTAGEPAVLARCINGGTQHTCRCIWSTNTYRNGVVFESDINWNESPAQAEAILNEADVVIVHNGYVESHHRPLLKGKAIVTMAHTYIQGVNRGLVEQGFPGVVVGQYQATLPEFKDWAVVPLPMPLWESAYQPDEKSEQVTICYTPANKHQVYPSDHPWYWHSKGYTATMQVLEKLARQFPLKLEVVRERQLPHIEVLAMKRRAHIVIDECVTGSYHTNSLEGLAAGCVVVNGVGLLPGVLDVMRYCAGEEVSNPFVFASLEVLEGVLTSLIERGVDSLIEDGWDNRLWMERFWGFAWQWRRFWLPVIEQAMQHTNSPRVAQLIPSHSG